MNAPIELAKSIFLNAVEISSDEVRRDYVEAKCGGNAGLRQEVQSLLEHHDCLRGFLEHPAENAAITVDAPVMAERPGTQIGPYKLHQEIGEGGMGVVYMALQKEPVRRKVALKIIKPGMDTREVIARFAAEEQALAMMDHPNIARVFDAGTTDSGRPYFVMELVNGVPITQYCDDNNATTTQRLELFTLVCHAVQHAHQKGIIHRDLKPSNILVTLHDGVPVPKIIDFGIAKAINQELTSQTMATGLGHMLGTPLYMSPEQAERSGLDIDTRSDIYSLGVLLYELLTGSTPFERGSLKDLGLDELRRVIREQEPPRPSTRISTMGKAATTVSEHRRTNPVELSNSLRHELDWIVMKALEKDRTRRYESANDFARDIQRYLRDEAVEACPPSTAYRLGKFVRRNRTAVLSIAAIGLALILGAGVAGGQAYRATKAEKYAEEQLQIAQEQKRLAREQEALAKKQQKLAEEAAQRERDLRTEAEAARKQSEAVTNFLVDIFRSPDPNRDGRTITMAEMLDKAKTRVQTEFKDDSALQANLLGAIAKTYIGLGLVQESSELAKQAYDTLVAQHGSEHPDTLAAMQTLADARKEDGHMPEALTLNEESLRLRKQVLGPTHPDTLESLISLAGCYHYSGRTNEAIRLLDDALPILRNELGLTHPQTLRAMGALTVFYATAGEIEKSLALGEEALQLTKKALGPEHHSTLAAMHNLASFYGQAQQRDRSIDLYEETIQLKTRSLGENHPSTLRTMVELSHAYTQYGEREKGIALLEGAVQGSRATFGPNDPYTLQRINDLCRQYAQAQRLEDAQRLLDEALQLPFETLDAELHDTQLSVSVLAGAYDAAGQQVRALSLREDRLRLLKAKWGSDHDVTLHAMTALAQAYRERGRLTEAAQLFEEALQGRKKRQELETPQTLNLMHDQVLCFFDAGRYQEAVEVCEAVLGSTRTKYGAESIMTIQRMANLADCYRMAERHEDALRTATEVWELTQKLAPPDSTHSSQFADLKRRMVAEAALVLGKAFSDAGRVNEALPLLQEAAEQHRQIYGPQQHQFLANTLIDLAIAHARAANVDQAAALMDEVVQMRVATLVPDHPHTLQAKLLLGSYRMQQADFAAAEKLLLEAYRGYTQRQAAGSTPFDEEQVRSATKILVELYEKSNQPEKVKEWQEKLGALMVEGGNRK